VATSGAQPGNQNAKKAKLWQEAVKRAVARKAAGNLANGLDNLADKLVAAAEAGEQWALLELGNRLDGKSPQALIGGDEDDPAIKTVSEILIRSVDATGDRSPPKGD
jgi:hypothetical protein